MIKSWQSSSSLHEKPVIIGIKNTKMGTKMANDCFKVKPTKGLSGKTTVPGDKSISHRAVMFGALAKGDTKVRGWLAAGDTEASLATIQALGVQVERHSKNEMT